MELISIIVPIFNAQQYLKRCLLSIVDQSYENLEIILIDDGSTDKSGEICNLFARLEHRFGVLHIKHNGVSLARNIGLDVAKGEYVTFVDADDYIHKDYIRYLYNLLKSKNADIAVSDREVGLAYKFVFNENKNEIDRVVHSEEYMRNWRRYKYLDKTSVCGKLYKKCLFDLNHFRFPDVSFYEDIRLSHLLVYYSRSIAITNRKLYYEYDYEYRLKYEISEKKICDNIEALEERVKFFLEHNYQDAYEGLIIQKQKILIRCYHESFILKSNDLRKLLLQSFERDNNIVTGLKSLKIYERVYFVLFQKVYKLINRF